MTLRIGCVPFSMTRIRIVVLDLADGPPWLLLFGPRHDAAAALDAFLFELLQAHVLRIFHFAICIEPFDLEPLAHPINAPALAIERHIAARAVPCDQALTDADS